MACQNKMPIRPPNSSCANLTRKRSRKRWGSNMKTIKYILVVVMLSVVAAGVSFAQDKMSKDQWQSEMATYKQKVTDLQAQVTKLTADQAAMKTQSDKLDADVR